MEFSLGFQLRLIVVFYTDKEFYVNSKDLIKIEFFNAVFLQWLFQLLETYVALYQALPTRAVIDEELKNDKTFLSLPEEQPLIAEFFELLTLRDKAEIEYVKNGFLKFAKERSLRSLLREQDESIEKGDFDSLFTELKKTSRQFDTFDQGVTTPFLFDLNHLKEIYDIKEGISTGIDLIDTVLKGLMPKEESLVLADTNVGKSLYLMQLGGAAVRKGKKTIHVTLEMSKARTLARYLANLSDDDDDICYSNIIDFEPQEKVYNYVHSQLRERYEGLLQIVDYPMGKCSIGNLYGLLDKYPDTQLLIVDYLQLLKPPKEREQLRFELSDITIALRGLASEANLHVATAQQASKLASNRRLVGKEFTAEDYGIFRPIDVGIGMGQDKNDALKQQVVFWLVKSRNTGKNVAERYQIDFRRMRFVKLRQESITDDC